jgi:3-oxoacyl-[acyl-carrier protein] reductase
MRAQRWGCFINISSYAAKCGGLTAGTAYSVSKSAVVDLTFSVARETAAQGITANAIAPAYVMCQWCPSNSRMSSENSRSRKSRSAGSANRRRSPMPSSSLRRRSRAPSPERLST